MIPRASAEGQVPTETRSNPTPPGHDFQLESSVMLGAAGESSLAAHSALACDYVHQVAGATALQYPGSEITGSLDALSHVVSSLREQTAASEMTYPHARPSQRSVPPGHELPPIKKTVDLIRIAKSQCLLSRTPSRR